MAPEGWTSTTVAELARVKRGASPRPINDSRWFSEDGPGWVRISDVTASRKFLRSTSQYLSEEGAARSVSVRAGELLLSIAGSVGKLAIVDMDACIHDGFVAFKNLDPQVSAEWFFYFLQTQLGWFEAAGQHGTQKNLNSDLVARLPVDLPPLPEQRKIAVILSSVDEAIERTEGVIEQLQRVKAAMMQELLTRGLPGRHTRFKSTPIGEVPEEWEVAPLHDIADVEWGNTNITKASYTPTGHLAFSASGPDGFLPQFEHEVDGVVLSAIGARCGKCYLASGTWTAIKNTITIIPRDSSRQEAVFLFHLLNRPDVWPKVGQAQPFISLGIARPLLIPLPPPEERGIIASAIEAFQDRIDREDGGVTLLRSVKSSLMSVLLTGELRVTPDPEAAVPA